MAPNVLLFASLVLTHMTSPTFSKIAQPISHEATPAAFCLGSSYFSPMTSHRVWSTKDSKVNLNDIVNLLAVALPRIKASKANIADALSSMENASNTELTALGKGPIIDVSAYNLGVGHGGKAMIVKANSEKWLKECRQAFMNNTTDKKLYIVPGIPLQIERDDSIAEIIAILKKLNVKTQPVHALISGLGAINPLTGGLIGNFVTAVAHSTQIKAQLAYDTSLLYLDAENEDYKIVASGTADISGLCFASSLHLEDSNPSRVKSTLYELDDALTDLVSKITRLQLMLIRDATPDLVNSEDKYHITPSPALYMLTDNLQMTAEKLNYMDFSPEDLGIFERTTTLARKLLAAYRIMGDYITIPMSHDSQNDMTLFKPKWSSTPSNTFIGELKYFDGSTFSQYLMYPQGFLSQEGEMVELTTRYLGYLDSKHPFTSSDPTEQYLCIDDDATGIETCDIRAPVDASPACGQALTTNDHTWDVCPSMVMDNPQFFLNSICDSSDNTVQLTTPYEVDVYTSCRGSQPSSIGRYLMGTHKIPGVNLNNPECHYAWTENYDLDSLKVEPLFRGASVKQNAIHSEGFIPKLTHTVKVRRLEPWEIATVIMVSICTLGCVVLGTVQVYHCFSCRACQSHARRHRHILTRFMNQEPDDEDRRVQRSQRTREPINDFPSATEQLARHAISMIAAVQQPEINPFPISPIERTREATIRAPPQPSAPQQPLLPASMRNPRSTTPSTVFLVNNELMSWAPIDHRLPHAERKEVKELVTRAHRPGVPIEYLPPSALQHISI